ADGILERDWKTQLCGGCPAYRGAQVSFPGPLPWARETAWGPRRREHSHAPPAANAIPEPRSVFPVWEPGPERAGVCAAIAVSYPHRPCTTRAFSGSLSPRQRSLSDERACACGSFLSCVRYWVVFISTRTKCRGNRSCLNMLTELMGGAGDVAVRTHDPRGKGMVKTGR
ncbi:hypothetical protein EI555_005821, partial [Monodon monoceros]